MNAPFHPGDREALERLLVSKRRGGQGWHKESSAAAIVRAILEAGRVRSKQEAGYVITARRLRDVDIYHRTTGNDHLALDGSLK